MQSFYDILQNVVGQGARFAPNLASGAGPIVQGRVEGCGEVPQQWREEELRRGGQGADGASVY